MENLKTVEKSRHNYKQIEDEIIVRRCVDCEEEYEPHEEHIEVCEDNDCKGQVVNETLLEDTECHICGKSFDMWEEGVRENIKTKIKICTPCYRKL
ncbi:hypothetical protein CN918_30435 [Priestia megaterium]|nr:hypothetical protein CN918_30435 [Priestia megaterium]